MHYCYFRLYYVNHVARITQWARPSPNVSQTQTSSTFTVTTPSSEPKPSRITTPTSPSSAHVTENSRHSVIADVVLNSNEENNVSQHRPILMSTDSSELNDSTQLASPSSSLSPISPTSPINNKPIIEQSNRQCKSPRNSIINTTTVAPNERQNNNTPLVNSTAINDRINNSCTSHLPENRNNTETAVRNDSANNSLNNHEDIQENQNRSQQNTPRQSETGRGRR